MLINKAIMVITTKSSTSVNADLDRADGWQPVRLNNPCCGAGDPCMKLSRETRSKCGNVVQINVTIGIAV